MRRISSSRLVVLTLFGLLLFYLFKDFSDQKNIHVHNIERKQKTRTPMTSHPFTWSSCQPNTSVSNITDFSTLPAHIKDFLFYQHCRHFPMLLNVPNKCGGADESSDVFLLLVIKSSPGNYERREVLRKTWAQERLYNGVWIHRIFISGTKKSGFEKIRQNKLLQLENRDYNDILQWDFEDTFFNLTLKQILFLEWMEMYCPNARFLFNGDDDVFANTDNMVEYLQGLEDNDGSKHLFTGHLIKNVGPIRAQKSKYYVPVQVHESNSYPPYCGGGGFLLSGFTATIIYNMSKSIPVLPIDDVYMGMCLTKAGLQPESHMGVKTAGMNIPSQRLDSYDPCYYKEVLLVHRFLPSLIYTMWQTVHDPHLNCEHLKISREIRR